MHVTRVELENIKAYDRAEFDFARGTTAIVGPNGAGKTTILEAVAWALFDTLEYNKDDFLRRGAKKGWVRVTFESDQDGRQYTVYRDTGQGYYVYDPGLGVRLAEKKTDVRAFLNQHLGIEPGTDLKALFRSAIGVPQGLLTADFRESVAERKAKFDRLLKVEEYREGAKRLGDTARLIGERLLEVHKRIANAEGQLARYDELAAERREAGARVEDLGASLDAARREATERARAVEELDARELRANEARTRAERLGVELAAAEARAGDLRTALDAARRAVERQRATENDYRAHLAALESLRALETQRAERERLRREESEAARGVLRAEAEARRLEEALARSRRARLALEELAPQVAEQESRERERESLRDLLAVARSARERLGRLERELAELRSQLSQTRERVRAAEAAEAARERAEELENERLGVETELSRVETALAARDVLAKQRKVQASEVERARRSLAAAEREARELERAAAGAERVSELEARERELAQQAARLRASVEHDERTCAELRGGVCPLLGDRCASFNDGHIHERHFAAQAAAGRAQLAEVESEAVTVAQALKGARVAATAAAQLAREQARLAQERRLLAAHEEKLAALDADLDALREATPQRKEELQVRLQGIDLVLKNAREDALRRAELESLRERLHDIEQEGRRKREEHDQLVAEANADQTLTQEITEVEKTLRALNDPRGRSTALRAEAEGEAGLSREAESARAALAGAERQRAMLEAELEKFSGLDEAWALAVVERDRTAEGYREYLSSAQLAATLSEREAEFEEATTRAENLSREAGDARREQEEALAAYDREAHSRERGQLSVARERAATLTAQLEAARGVESRLSADLARLDEVRDSLRDEFGQKDHLGEMQEATEFVRDVLRQAGPHVAKSYVYNISIEANQLFREITGEGGRALRWSEDYEILLEEGGHERSFQNLSGGEQMAAALSVRLALLKQLSDIRLAFFDEPTVNMDEERRRNLAQQIGQVRHFDQLFVISHDDTFEETVDQVVTLGRAAE